MKEVRGGHLNKSARNVSCGPSLGRRWTFGEDRLSGKEEAAIGNDFFRITWRPRRFLGRKNWYPLRSTRQMERIDTS
jgi:hypothetical protein